MAVSKSANTYNRQNWEISEFPILCQTCLGDNPYIRMTKEKFGKECKICARPFTVFRWCPGARMRFKKTEVCQTCCKLKNVCQTCLLDLEYGLPVQVRDSGLNVKDDIPKSDVNKEYYTQNAERDLSIAGDTNAPGEIGKTRAPSDVLLKLARTTPYYKRNRPHICSFWVKGECKRGEECPYRHDKPTDPDDPLADQNIKDRYYGVNDPVADKLMRRAATMPGISPPEDRSITTLYVGGLGDKVTEKDLRDHFYQFGEIRSVNVIPKQQCAFVQFTNRSTAEAAAEASFNKLIVNGRRLVIKWGKSQAGRDGGGGGGGGGGGPGEAAGQGLEPVPGLPGPLPMPSDELQNNFFNLHQSAPPMLGQPGMPAMRPPPMVPPGMRPPMPPPPGLRPPGTWYPNLPRPPGGVVSMAPVPGGYVVPQQQQFVPIHYPSQDPQRMGSVEKGGASSS